jgi:hypothetical protein
LSLFRENKVFQVIGVFLETQDCWTTCHSENSYSHSGGYKAKCLLVGSPCSLVEVDHRFRIAYWLQHQDDESSSWRWRQYAPRNAGLFQKLHRTILAIPEGCHLKLLDFVWISYKLFFSKSFDYLKRKVNNSRLAIHVLLCATRHDRTAVKFES